MADDIVAKVAPVTLSSSDSGTIDITTSDLGGKTPKAVIFILTGSAAASAQDTLHGFYGMAVSGTEEYGGCFSGRTGFASTVNYRSWGEASAIRMHEPDDRNAVWAKYDFNSFITDGVRLTVTTAADNTTHGFAILFAGDDLSVHADELIWPSASGGTRTTSPGFQTDMCFLITMIDDENPSYGRHNGFGVAVKPASTIIQRGLCAASANGKGYSEPTLRVATDMAVGTPSAAWQAEVTTMDANDVVITNDGTAGATDYRIAVLCLNFGGTVKGRVFDVDSLGATGTWDFNGVGTEPQITGLALSDATTRDTQLTDHEAGAFGLSVADSDGNVSSCWWDEEDNSNNSDCRSGEDNLFASYWDDDHDTQQADIDAPTFDSGGWTANVDAYPSESKEWWGWSIDAASGGGGPTGHPSVRRFGGRVVGAEGVSVY